MQGTQPDPLIPPSLAKALSGLRPAIPAVPAAADDAVLDAARARADLIRRRRATARVLARIGAVAAAAAVVLAAVLIPRIGHTPLPPVATGVPAHPATDPRDVNGDGVVDILDAYALARTLDAEDERRVRAIRAGWDFTGDGLVDGRDVDHVAMTAVRLREGGRG